MCMCVMVGCACVCVCVNKGVKWRKREGGGETWSISYSYTPLLVSFSGHWNDDSGALKCHLQQCSADVTTVCNIPTRLEKFELDRHNTPRHLLVEW